MVDIAEVEAVIAAVTSIVQEIIKIAPSIEQGIADEKPYVQALVGLIEGTNVTQDQLNAAVINAKSLSAKFQQY